MTHPADSLCVIGGGPAGAAAAIQLSRQGLPTILIEKQQNAKDRVCGEFFSGESYRYLQELGVRLETLGALPISTVRFAGNDVLAEQALPFPAWSLRRSVLDDVLLTRAQDEGVTVLRGHSAESLRSVRARWHISLNDHSEIVASDVFLATGKYDLRGWKRPSGRQDDLVAFKMYFTLDREQLRQLEGCIELAVFDGGYAGLQVIDDERANLSLLISRNTLRQIGSQWVDVYHHMLRTSRHLARRLQNATPSATKPLALSSIPYGYRRESTEPSLWALGDQAAVIPSLSGDGISIALHSGFLAAKRYGEGGDANSFQREMAKQLRYPVAVATWISRTILAIPQIAGALRLYPELLRILAQQTRIPNVYKLHTD